MTSKITSPIASKNPKSITRHKHTRTDDYYWMNERENPETIAYLNAENEYYNKMTENTKDFQKELYEEMKARIKEDDTSVPYFFNGYYYITRFETGKNYPIFSRKKGSLDASEEIMFDCNEMAIGEAFFNLAAFSVSPDNKFATFSTDTVGRRIYSIKIKNLETGEVLFDHLQNTTGSCVWANDNKTIFYTSQDQETLRADKVYRHQIGDIQASDEIIYFEKDDTFTVDVHKSKSRKYIVIDSESTLTTESRILNADKPLGKFNIFQRRKRGIEYSILHYKDHFYIRTNADDAENFKLMKTPEATTKREFWEDVIPHREEVLFEDCEIFSDYLVLEERTNGLTRIRIMPWENGDEYYLPFESETYTAFSFANVDFDTKILRYTYQSMNTPSSIIDFNMETKEKTVLKEQEILGGKFDKENYKEERIWVTARDGVKVPVSLVYKRGIEMNGKNPLLQYAYGSYGASMDAHFSSTRLSLLDRGFIYVITHVRGGEDLGRNWYETGKLLTKKNTFTDFIDCSKFLIEKKYTSAEHLYAEGGSAGGMLMGVIANEAPELYNGIIAQVPFVDVVTTMLDDSIPLTTGEYDEWGNPNKKKFYNYMLSYSPYDNVKAQKYPNMYISTGLHDSQVQYWEPAKWVAKLREFKTDDNILFLDTNMDAGHGGASGRFEALKELAKEFSFLLNLEINKK